MQSVEQGLSILSDTEEYRHVWKFLVILLALMSRNKYINSCCVIYRIKTLCELCSYTLALSLWMHIRRFL